MRSDRGQGTVEYVALVALVLLLAGAATAGAVAAPGLVNAVQDALRRGLCALTGQECLVLARRPCVVSARARDERVTVHAGLVRLGDHAGLLREELSDGSVILTLIDDLGAGLQAGLGAEGHLDLGGLHVGGGELVAAAAMGELGARRSWHVRDRAAADALARRLRGPTGVGVVDHAVQEVAGLLGLDDGPPDPDEVTFSAGARGLAQARLGLGPAGLDLAVTGALSAGGRWNRRTGERTILLRGDGQILATLARGVLHLRLGAADQAGAALVVGRDGRPRELVVGVAGRLDHALPPSAGRRLAVRRTAGRRGELDARLDLTEPGHLAVVRRALAALAAHPLPGTGMAQAAGPVLALAATMARDARLDARWYAAAHLGAGAGADVGAGGRIGGDVELSRDDLRLLDAWSRPPGGLWEQRVDCLEAA